jgi:hypothetical protein
MSIMSTVQTLERSFKDLVLTKLGGYNKPVKTKHLAQRLRIERVDLVATLNQLRKQKKIDYIKINNSKDDYRGREDISYGWVLTP